MTETTTRPVYRELAARLAAIRNCQGAHNTEWEIRHREAVKELVDLLPSGSGIDNGIQLCEGECTETKIAFSFGYHHMNDAGMYDGWTEHMLYVTPSFDGINLRITGRDRNSIKEYLYDLFHCALTAPSSPM